MCTYVYIYKHIGIRFYLYQEFISKIEIKEKEKTFMIEDCHIFKANAVNILNNKNVSKCATRNKAQ